MVAALRAQGLPVGYFLYAGEQHGFRRAENKTVAGRGAFVLRFLASSIRIAILTCVSGTRVVDFVSRQKV